jgi:transcriptional regulator with XRE-family HTH domain
MSIFLSWRDMLRDAISEPFERERIARAVGVSSATLIRWSKGISSPRPQNLGQLQRAFMTEKHAEFVALLTEEFGPSPEGETPEPSDMIDFSFVRQIWEVRAMTPEHLLFWTLCRKVLEHASRQIDSARAGVMISVVQCVPSRTGKVHTLRETIRYGTEPWSADLSSSSLFLGGDSLAGYAVSYGRMQIVDDLREQNVGFLPLTPLTPEKHEVSAAAHPIFYASRIAGCVLFFSTLPGYFHSDAQRSLIADYTHLIAQAFKVEQFYPLEQIALQVMPPLEVQQAKFSTFQQRVTDLMKEAYQASHMLTRSQAEELVGQQFAEELLLFSQQNKPVDKEIRRDRVQSI